MAAARYEQNEDFFVKMFSDPDMMKQVMDTIGSVLYERLKKKVYYYEPKTTSQYEQYLKERYDAINNAKKKK